MQITLDKDMSLVNHEFKYVQSITYTTTYCLGKVLIFRLT